MGSATMEARGATEVAKRCFKNNTAGWLGVVKLNHLGGPEGATVKPGGYVYLSDDECKLTARAPEDPKNNPFIEQIFRGIDAQGMEHPMPITPLTLIEDERFVPDEDNRFVPGIASRETEEAAARDAERLLSGASERDQAIPTLAPEQKIDAAPQPIQAAGPEQKQLGGDGGAPNEVASWTDNPDRTETPKPGSLGGGVAVQAADDADPVAVGSPTGAPPQAPAPVGTGQVAEEHAAITETGEETGAAETPVGRPAEGEFAQHEEVGSPDAPTATADSSQPERGE